MKMKLSTLLEILKPLMEKCNDELAVHVNVIVDNGDPKEKKHLLIKKMSEIYDFNVKIPDAEPNNPIFEIAFTFPDNMSGFLMLTYHFQLDISAIKSELMQLGKMESLADVENFIPIMRKEYINILPLLGGLNNGSTDYKSIADILSQNIGNVAFKNFGF